MAIRTHYDNLKVTRDAPISVIRAAYKALCQTYHPDKFQGSNEEAERVIKLVNASFAVLNDPVKRAGHNAWIKEQEAQQQSEEVQPAETEQQPQQKQDAQREYTQPPPGTSTETLLQRAYDLSDRGRYAEAFAINQQLAEQGIAKAEFNLGVMYDRGQHVRQDYAEAVSWYLKAAGQGNANAQYNLALKYQAGQGVEKDESQAAYWYRKAAETSSAN
jgi:curved DNA-binding protein CbpA